MEEMAQTCEPGWHNSRATKIPSTIVMTASPPLLLLKFRRTKEDVEVIKVTIACAADGNFFFFALPTYNSTGASSRDGPRNQ